MLISFILNFYVVLISNFARQWELNAWEFEILKRIVRCRKKGEWLSDLTKTKEVIDIYIKECKDDFKGRDLEISEKF